MNEIFPFFIHADQIFLKYPDDKIESLNNTTNIHSICIQTKEFERFSLFKLCPMIEHFILMVKFLNIPQLIFNRTVLSIILINM